MYMYTHKYMYTKVQHARTCVSRIALYSEMEIMAALVWQIYNGKPEHVYQSHV